MRRHYRSFFWPVVLIVIGIFALLIDLNVISADRIYRLADLWPLLLIVIGLELITRRTLHGTAVDIAAVMILLIAGVGAIAYVAVGPAIPGGTHTLTASDQVGSLTAANLVVEVGAADLTVVGDTSMGSDLYRAEVTYSGPKPDITLDKSTGELRLSQQGEFGIFGSRHLAIDLHISPSVTWSISLNSGAANATFKLTDVKVTSIESNTGAIRLDITVGPPKGIVSIKANGGALTVLVHRPSGTEVSVQVSGGAVNLSADGHHTGAIGKARWQSDGYANAKDAYAIEVSGGACTVTVDTNVPAN
jgi:uncharacterized membrane protein YhaH (DUF805 family)